MLSSFWPKGSAVRCNLQNTFPYLMCCLLSVGMISSGCSVVGFTIGAVSDSKDWSYRTVSIDSLGILEPGDDIVVTVSGRRGGSYQRPMIYDSYEKDTESILGRTVTGSTSVELASVRKIMVRTPRIEGGHAKWYGLGIGLAIDALIVAISMGNIDY